MRFKHELKTLSTQPHSFQVTSFLRFLTLSSTLCQQHTHTLISRVLTMLKNKNIGSKRKKGKRRILFS
ncbi:LOW QUALITY PROTEIN: hypothetical protein TorRG33x02_061830 [Trema orientale]|uniref:Uncharacterized protein n=1 Tax=Trema orientale TaxID=63057 RepID=A0A2P5FJZ8_TREOI|nr:LOW QUALITY PROTEIN: hypothetical protein TorRG33x02_061830 [Trema orientale]